MDSSLIIQAVDESIDDICKDFKSNPTLFYTENDIACYFYSIFQEKVKYLTVSDKDNSQHFIIHREYPTPFRCDMKGNNFEVKSDIDRTLNGGKYKRGHYDIVILNPDFIRQYPYDVIKGQNYELYKEKVLNSASKSTVLYGLEFMFSRDPIKLSKGSCEDKGIDQFIAKVIQDADKLNHSISYNNFMKYHKMVVFIKGCSEKIQNKINNKLHNRKQEIKICFAK